MCPWMALFLLQKVTELPQWSRPVGLLNSIYLTLDRRLPSQLQRRDAAPSCSGAPFLVGESVLHEQVNGHFE